ncbi:MAG: hypothetical protein QGI46_03115 [Planctomycetota bacterium]|nr:hypothetical protein [Planctomycetota bacterium]
MINEQLLALAFAVTFAGTATALQDGGTPFEPAVPQAPLSMLRFRDGSIQWGRILEHTSDEVSFERIDTGGLVRAPWGLLDPVQENDLRMRFGYIEVEGEEIMMTAQLLVLIDGSEIVGKILGYTEKEIIVKDQSGTRYVSKALVRDTRDGLWVSALELYTKEELYNQEFVGIDIEDAQAHFDLAVYCERILAFSHALEHYLAAQSLDGQFMADELAVIIPRVEIKVGQQEQLDFLAAVDQLKRRKNYDEALTQLEVFDGLFEESPLHVDRLKLADRIVKARDKHVREEVKRRWYLAVERLSGVAARGKGYEETLGYLDETMSEEILAYAYESVLGLWAEVESDQVRQMWLERKPGRWRPASYGLGTWLLGEERALAGGPVQAQAAPASERDQERAALEERIAAFLRNQEMAKAARGSEEDEEDLEAFWAGLSYAARKNWIVAYYAENSGEVELRKKPELHNCRECGGTGTREVLYTGSARSGGPPSGMRLVACETCKGIGRTRRVRYR